MSTPVMPATPSMAPSWINLLISLGASLGTPFISNSAVASLINIAATTTENLITQIATAKSVGTTNNASAPSLIVPIFVSVLKAAIAAALAEGKVKASDATELTKALTALGTEDAIAKTIVDYSTIGPIATV